MLHPRYGPRAQWHHACLSCQQLHMCRAGFTRYSDKTACGVCQLKSITKVVELNCSIRKNSVEITQRSNKTVDRFVRSFHQCTHLTVNSDGTGSSQSSLSLVACLKSILPRITTGMSRPIGSYIVDTELSLNLFVTGSTLFLHTY